MSSNLSPNYRTPAYIRRIIENSAKFIPHVDPLGQGHGLLQLFEAWNAVQRDVAYSQNSAGTLPEIKNNIQKKMSVDKHELLRQVTFNVSFQQAGLTCRGIYLRQLHECSVTNSWVVSVNLDWPKEITVDQKVTFEFSLKLKLRNPCPWISHSTSLLLVNSTLNVNVKIDPTALPSGHYSNSVCAFIEGEEYRGPLFEIPVTVVKPLAVPTPTAGTGTTGTAAITDACGPIMELGTLTLGPAERHRTFIAPPAGCTYIDLVISDMRDQNGGTSTGDSYNHADTNAATFPPTSPHRAAASSARAVQPVPALPALALIAASAAGDFAHVMDLLLEGADIDSKDVHGMSALAAASENGMLDLVEFLVEEVRRSGDLDGMMQVNLIHVCM